MDYNNFSVERRVNATAMFSYGLLSAVLVICYFIEVLKKSRSLTYFIIFTILALLPYIISKLLIAKNKESEKVKYVISVGFLIFYSFIIFTTVSPVAYVYAIIIAVILLCYNQKKLVFFYKNLF